MVDPERWPGVRDPAITDITGGLQSHTPPIERWHQLLIVHAQLFIATGQLRRAAADYNAVLADDPNNSQALQGLRRTGPEEGL